jgi:hypothetical protein
MVKGDDGVAAAQLLADEKLARELFDSDRRQSRGRRVAPAATLEDTLAREQLEKAKAKVGAKPAPKPPAKAKPAGKPAAKPKTKPAAKSKAKPKAKAAPVPKATAESKKRASEAGSASAATAKRKGTARFDVGAEVAIKDRDLIGIVTGERSGYLQVTVQEPAGPKTVHVRPASLVIRNAHHGRGGGKDAGKAAAAPKPKPAPTAKKKPEPKAKGGKGAQAKRRKVNTADDPDMGGHSDEFARLGRMMVGETTGLAAGVWAQVGAALVAVATPCTPLRYELTEGGWGSTRRMRRPKPGHAKTGARCTRCARLCT